MGCFENVDSRFIKRGQIISYQKIGTYMRGKEFSKNTENTEAPRQIINLLSLHLLCLELGHSRLSLMCFIKPRDHFSLIPLIYL